MTMLPVACVGRALGLAHHRRLSSPARPHQGDRLTVRGIRSLSFLHPTLPPARFSLTVVHYLQQLSLPCINPACSSIASRRYPRLTARTATKDRPPRQDVSPLHCGLGLPSRFRAPGTSFWGPRNIYYGKSLWKIFPGITFLG